MARLTDRTVRSLRGIVRRQSIVGMLLMGLCLAGEQAYAESDAVAALEGTYKHPFDNALMNGKRYRSSNTLDILRLSPTTAYFSTHLEFMNGHTCDLAGIADLQRDGSLMYWEKGIPDFKFDGRQPDGSLAFHREDREDRRCVFTIRPTKSGVVFEDRADPASHTNRSGVCQQEYCGNRGLFEGIHFGKDERHPIDAKAVKRSDGYRDAIMKREKCPHALGWDCSHANPADSAP